MQRFLFVLFVLFPLLLFAQTWKGDKVQATTSIRVGSGPSTTSPLTAYGAFSLQHSSAVANLLKIGPLCAPSVTGAGGLYIGANIGSGITASYVNTIIGQDACATGNARQATYIGFEAGKTATSTSYSTAYGPIAIGHQAAYQSTGYGIQCIGFRAGYANTGNNPISIGNNAGYANAGNDGIFIGLNCGYTNRKTNMIGIGERTGEFNNGDYSTFIGYYTGRNNIGLRNLNIGNEAGAVGARGGYNVFIGDRAGFGMDGGSNVVIGKGNTTETYAAPNYTFASTDVNVSSNVILNQSAFIAALALNAGDRIMLDFRTGAGSTLPGGITNGENILVEVLGDFSTLQIINETVTTTGSGTTNFYRAFEYQTNNVIIGDPGTVTGSNKIVLGNASSATIKAGNLTISTAAAGTVGQMLQHDGTAFVPVNVGEIVSLNDVSMVINPASTGTQKLFFQVPSSLDGFKVAAARYSFGYSSATGTIGLRMLKNGGTAICAATLAAGTLTVEGTSTTTVNTGDYLIFSITANSIGAGTTLENGQISLTFSK